MRIISQSRKRQTIRIANVDFVEKVWAFPPQRKSNANCLSKKSGPYLFLIAFVLMQLSACTSESNPPENGNRQKVVGNALPQRERPVDKDTDPPELKLESLSIEDFLDKFRYRAKPKEFFIGTDFVSKIDPTLYHFQRVEIILPDGSRTEIRMQYFGAWAIWKNVSGNYEMLTTLINDSGVMMHLHTLNPKFESLGTFEIARRTEDGMAVMICRGKFINDDMYEYTVATRSSGVLSDTINGLMVVMHSGNHKILSETSAK